MQNEQVKHVVSLHSNKNRKEFGEFIVEGKRFVQEALLRKAKINKIYYCPQNEKISYLIEQALQKQIPVEEVTEAVMHKMSTTKEPQDILAIAEKHEYDWQDISLNKNSILLIIDQIQDPGNLGTILRTALAADVQDIIMTKGTVDIYNPKVLRSSMGAIFSLRILLEDRKSTRLNSSHH